MSEATGYPVAGLLRRRFHLWINRRLQPATRHKLNRHTVFILPSRSGLGFLAVNCLLWLAGTNYENNLILSLAFLQTSLFVVCIHHTFFNMTGLTLEVLRTAPCYVGEMGELELQVSRGGGSPKESIQLGYCQEALLSLDLIEHSSTTVKLFVPALSRGWYLPQRILVESVFPLGLIRCWSWLAFDKPILVYPRPLAREIIPLKPAAGDHGEVLERIGSEDFYGLKNYTPGMPTRHIAWKHYARGQGLFSKEYVAYRAQTLWLDWQALEGLGVETRLSYLCFWVRKLGATDQPFGLSLPGLTIEPDSGIAQQHRALKALALFQWRPEKNSAARNSP